MQQMPPSMAGPMPQQPRPMPQPMAQQPPPRQQLMPQNDEPVTTAVRGVSGEPNRPAPAPVRALPPEPVRIPSPEQLGVAAPRPRDPNLDWESIRKRLHALGAVSFQLDTLPAGGGFRFVCHLATAEFGQTQGIAGQASTEAEAVNQALARAEMWKKRN
jgi:hypothetical protein